MLAVSGNDDLDTNFSAYTIEKLTLLHVDGNGMLKGPLYSFEKLCCVEKILDLLMHHAKIPKTCFSSHKIQDNNIELIIHFF